LGDVIVIEADEYDRTFLKLTPALALITNIEAEHLDIYEDLDDIKQAFTQYANSVPFFGAAIVCLDDPNVRDILSDIHRRVLTYGTSRQAEVRAENIEQVGASTHFDVFRGNDRLGGAMLHAPGVHNVLNALGAVAVGLELDVPFETIVQGLAMYTGVDRRFQIRGEAGGVIVVDDYAHHPTEIIVTLDAATAGWPSRRIVAVFQPHLYSRTAHLADDFARAFVNADVLVLTDIFGAREDPIEGVDGAMLAELAEQNGHRAVHYMADKTELPAFLLGLVESGDLVITMGAGDIWRQGKAFFEQLVERNTEVAS
jgi:UDP-N-acetylmuramate--alanine ligase